MRINKGFNPPYRINLNSKFTTCLAKYYSSTNSPSENNINYLFNNTYFPSIKRGFSSYTCFYYPKTKESNSVNNSFSIESPIYNNLNIILRDNPTNEETQKKIEKFLFDYSYISLEENDRKDYGMGGINYSIINPSLTKILLENEKSLIKLIHNFKNEYISINSAENDEITYKELANILKDVQSKNVISIMYGYLLKIITIYQRTDQKTNSMVDVCYNMGRDLVNNFYFINYTRIKSNKKNEIYYLSNWKSENKDILDKLEDSTVLFTIGSVLVGWLLTCKLVDKKTVTISKNEKNNVILPSNMLNETIKNKIAYSIPKKLPMIVPPKPYGEHQLGGYLLNDEVTTDPLIKSKRTNKELSLINNDNVIYNAVNKVSCVGYKINKNMLNFIMNHSNDYLKDEMVDPNYDHPLLNKSKLSRKDKVELDSFLSKKDLQENILGLASAFSNVPSFYFPINLDFRGRLNCISEYLNYQSNSMAKSLLLFSKGEIIQKHDTQAINYLKLYGATCFGLDKKSANERLKWVDSNVNDIVNFENGVLIKKAKDKFLFTAFCHEYKRWIDCFNNHNVDQFETFLPVQLDATCNGFQHLSLLSLDPSLGIELNLEQSSWENTPKDFYSFILTSIIDYFKSELASNKLDKETKESYTRLVEFNFKRSIIKKSIMTIPYNVSSYQLVNYIKENFYWIEGTSTYKSKEDGNVILHSSDFNSIGKALREVLEYKFPKLKLLLDYLEEIAKVCSILQIPIMWTLPSGLVVKQGYLTEDEIRIKPFFFHKNRISLKTLNKDKLNRTKQIRAFMPNLVHSLDAASLVLLLDSYFNDSSNSIYTIHDCFAVPANKVSNLLEHLKLTYIKIYSDETYLMKLDNGIIESIKNIFGESSFNNQTREIYVSDIPEKIKFPDINIVLGKNPKLNLENLRKSAYILN